MKKKKLQKILFIFSIFLFVIPTACSKNSNPVLEQKKATVTIALSDKERKEGGLGSGFIIDPSGIIATNYHVIKNWIENPNTKILVRMQNGAFFTGESIIMFDKEKDVAIFNINIQEGELPTVKLATNYKPEQGEKIFVIGSPLGLETTISDGIISNVRKKQGLIQITAPISQGSSGSPVFNTKAEVIGIATGSIEEGQNLNFAIPIIHISNLLEESKKPQKKIEQAKLPQPPVPVPAPSPKPQTTPAPDKETKPTDKLDRGAKYYLESAKVEVKKNPNSAEAHDYLGLIYYSIGKHQEAMKAFKQAIKLKPDYAKAHFHLGNFYSMQKMDKEAVEEFKQTIRINPNDALAYQRLCSGYFILGMFNEAVEECKQAIKLKPDLEDAYYWLGATYNIAGMHRNAVEELKQAIRLKPDHAEAHYSLGIAYVSLNDKSSAIEEYKTLKILKPELANRLFNLIYE